MLASDRGVGPAPFRLDQDLNGAWNSGFIRRRILMMKAGNVFLQHLEEERRRPEKETFLIKKIEDDAN